MCVSKQKVQQVTPSMTIKATIMLPTACSKMTSFLYSGKQGRQGWALEKLSKDKSTVQSCTPALLVLDPGAAAPTHPTVERLNVATATTLQKELYLYLAL